MAPEIPGGWPEWCLFPTPALHALIPSPDTVASPAYIMRNALVARMLGLYAWRQGRTIWRFDSDVAAALIETEDIGRVPAEVLRRLPQWGVYVQRPNVAWPGDAEDAHGVLARLDTQAVVDFESITAPVLHIQYDLPSSVGIGLATSLVPLVPDMSLSQVLALVRESFARRDKRVEEWMDHLEKAMLRPWLALLMYLCSQGVDTERQDAPETGIRSRTQHGRNDHVTRIDVGFRVGAAIRQSRSNQTAAMKTGRTVAPHLRRAHFHTFYSGVGSRTDPSKRQVNVRWLPPIAVGAGDVAPVVRPVIDDGSSGSRQSH